MKLKVIIIAILTLFLFLNISCEKETINDDNPYPNAKIIKELPFIYGNVCEQGKTIIINSQQELNSVWNSMDSVPDFLTNIDFQSHTLILGTTGNGNEVSELNKQTFEKMGNNQYKYSVFVYYCLSNACVGTFVCGIIVDKIPSNSQVALIENELLEDEGEIYYIKEGELNQYHNNQFCIVIDQGAIKINYIISNEDFLQGQYDYLKLDNQSLNVKFSGYEIEHETHNQPISPYGIICKNIVLTSIEQL